MHKFMRLAHSEQWTEVEQHVQFCFALEGIASKYYTLLLKTDHGVAWGPSLRNIDEALWILCAGPYTPVELSVGSAKQWGVPPPVV